MSRRRLGFLVTLFAAGALAHPASAATKPLVTDPAGDAVALGKGYDIVSANLTTSGTTGKAGKRPVSTPTTLVASVTLAGAPSTAPGYTVRMRAKTSACDGGAFDWSWTPGNRVIGESDLYVQGCGAKTGLLTRRPYEFVGADVSVAGSTITWKTKLKEFGKDLRLGATFTDFVVYVDQNEPAGNFYGTGIGHDSDLADAGVSLDKLARDTAVDTARSAAKYVLR